MKAVFHYLHYLLRMLALACLLLGGAVPARADTAIALTQSFNGAVNFTGTQVTLRTQSNNGNACAVASSTTNRTATLTLPSGATVLSAQLYWAGSGSADNTVTFQGKSVAATRKYSSSTVGNGMNYFGGAADVTDTVKAKGSGTYSFSGLTVSTGNPWCASQAVLGGFSLLVVYSHPNEAERVLNLYEGFRYLQNSEFTLTATNFRWPTPWLPIREKARVGHITWEGDSTLLASGENLLFNGNELTDDMNQSGNQFNSKSNINRDSYSYGIDFDAYDTEVVQWIFYAPTVTTTYRTGQDLVILNAEVLLVPTLPVSDLSLSMTRGGSLQVGQTASYALTVKNNGPYTEAGPITVTDTLPAGMSYASSSGSGWTCAANGQVVTCTYRTAIAPNASAPPLTINATVNQAGSLTNSATVTGTSDNNNANNTVSDTATGVAAPVTTSGYKFTAKECPIGSTYNTVACPAYDANMRGGSGTPATIYVTAFANNRAAAPGTSAATTVPMQFSLTCQDPASGTVGARYGGVTLQPCTANGATPAAGSTTAWSSSTNVAFEKSKASAALPFVYEDVGLVQLNLLANKNVASSNGFVSLPTTVAFKSGSIVSLDGLVNPGATGADGPGFARAGEDFNAALIALLSDGKTAPNFGNESTLPDFDIAMAPLAGVEKMTVPGKLAEPVRIQNKNSGSVTVKLNYDEVGIITLQPTLLSYLTTGTDVGASGSTTIGRFFPDHYETRIDSAPLECEEPMKCAPDLSGAAYSGQPFDVQVSAHNAKGVLLQNYEGAWRRPITLTAMTAEGGDQASGNKLKDDSAALGSDSGVARMSGSTSATLPVPYNVDATTAPSAPAAIFIRASSSELLPGKNADGSQKTATVTSKRNNPDDAEEAGIMLVNGRLNVGSAQGTNTRRTPLTLQAQYFDGANWNNDNDTSTAFAPASTFRSCLLNLKTAGAKDPAANQRNLDNCNAAIVKDASAQAVTLTNGAGVYWLAAPGAANAGSTWVQVGLPGWLPGTRGRVNFGATRKPTIYLREVY